MRYWLPGGIAVMAAAGFALAQRMVIDQGRPGREGAWPVTGNVSVSLDGGMTTTPAPCTTNAHKITVVTSSTAVSTPSSQLTGRRFIVLCNSLQNSGSPILKCRVDGVSPVIAAGNPGDVLGIGDCIQYAIPSSVVPHCISNSGAGINVTSYECL